MNSSIKNPVLKRTIFNRMYEGLKNFFTEKRNKNINNKELIYLLKTKSSKDDINTRPELYMLNNIINMREETAEDILTPRVDIIAVERDISLDELIKIFTKHGYSRLPVYNESLDETLGFIHVKDLINILKKGSDLNIDSILRPVLFVSPYIKILDLLFEMIAKRHHIAMVVDEFGGIDGLVTIEDIIEEIVGDITDEYDKFLKKMIFVNKPNYLEVDARLTTKELENITGSFLTEEEKEEVETVGGLIAFLSGRLGKRKEIIRHPSGVEFEILEADSLKVIKIGVHYKNLASKKNLHDENYS